MAYPLLVGIYQVTIDATLDSQEYNNVFHHRVEEPNPAADLIALASQYANGYAGTLLSQQHSGFVLIGATARYIGDASYPTYTYTLAEPEPGTATGTPLPNNVAICMSKATSEIPVVKRGRVYMSGLTSSQVVNTNFISPTQQGNFNTVWESFLASVQDVPTALGDMVVLGGYKDGAIAAEVNASHVSSIYCRDRILDSSRRRLPGRGR